MLALEQFSVGWNAAGRQVAAKSVLAPLIGHELFFGGPEIASAQQPTADAKPAAPKPAPDLHAGTSTYRGWVDAEGKRTDFVSTRTIMRLKVAEVH